VLGSMVGLAWPL